MFRHDFSLKLVYIGNF